MKLKYVLTLLVICINISVSISQTGLYKCNNYEFKSEVDPSKNSAEYDSKILTLDLDAINNKYFMWRVTDTISGDDVFFKWNVKNKLDATYVKEKNYVQTTYEVKMELIGIETGEPLLLYKIDDLNDKSLNIIVYSPKFKTSRCFYGLTKF